MSNGIDMNKSGWTNPEGFQRAPRPAVHVDEVKACEAPGPDGWVCDLPPGHAGDEHWADDASPKGFRWRTEMHDVSTLTDPPDQPRLIPGRIVPEVGVSLKVRIRELAQSALDNPAPASWAVALSEIIDLTREL